jgi:cytochrome c biogenesis protein
MPSQGHKPPGKVLFWRPLWSFLTSPRLALALIIVIVVLCLIGVFIIQAPASTLADPSVYNSWVQNVARPRFGVLTDVLSFLQLFSVFHSLWFFLAGGLLMMNIFFCTINRWKSVFIKARGGNIRQPASFYSTGTNNAESNISASSSEAASALADILKEHHYRVKMDNSGDNINIAADKNRFSPFGTFLTHSSLILFVLGFIVSSFWGFRNESFIVPEGSIQEVGYGTHLSLELKSFEDDYWPDGIPKDFRSEVVLYDGEQPVAQALVRVNSPLSYHGINFYQSGFGPAPRIQVKDGEKEIFDECVPLWQVVESDSMLRSTGGFRLPDSGIMVRLLGPALDGQDPVIGKNEIGTLLYEPGMDQPTGELLDTGTSFVFGGLQFSLVSQGRYSVFQVSRSPGVILIWIACGLIVIGLGLIFYLPYRQLRALAEPQTGNESRLILRAMGKAGPGNDEINTLMQRVKKTFTDNRR